VDSKQKTDHLAFIREGFGNEYQKSKRELKKTAWGAFVITSIISLIIGSIITIFAQYIINNNSPGNFHGERLRLFIEEIIANELNGHNVELVSLSIGDTHPLNETETIIVFGTYRHNESEVYGEFTSDVFIAILERGEKRFIHHFLSIEPAYYINFLMQTRDKILTGFDLQMRGSFFVEDINNSGVNELGVEIYSRFANRVSSTYLFFARNEGNWNLCNFDFSEQIYALETEHNGGVLFDVATFYIDGDSIDIKMGMDGGLFFGFNPIRENPVFLFTTSFFSTDYQSWWRENSAFFMFEFDGVNFIHNDSWNGGNAMVVNRFDESVNPFAFENFGTVIGNLVFYR